MTPMDNEKAEECCNRFTARVIELLQEDEVLGGIAHELVALGFRIETLGIGIQLKRVTSEASASGENIPPPVVRPVLDLPDELAEAKKLGLSADDVKEILGTYTKDVSELPPADPPNAPSVEQAASQPPPDTPPREEITPQERSMILQSIRVLARGTKVLKARQIFAGLVTDPENVPGITLELPGVEQLTNTTSWMQFVESVIQALLPTEYGIAYLAVIENLLQRLQHPPRE